MVDSKLNFKMYGSGDPIIILHGFLGSLDNWQTFAKKLAADHLVITIDHRNHGKSFHSDDFSYDHMVEDLKTLMEEEWIHEAVVIGHSMGGKTAMHMSMQYPDMIEKLIVVDIAPKEYVAGHHDILEALNAVPIASIRSRKEADEILKKYIHDAGVRLFLMKNLKRDGVGYSWKANLNVLTTSYDEILKEIQGDVFEEPTLFIRGSQSRYILDSDMNHIRSLYPSAEVKTIENAGHWVHAEQPEELYRVVNGFINE